MNAKEAWIVFPFEKFSQFLVRLIILRTWPNFRWWPRSSIRFLWTLIFWTMDGSFVIHLWTSTEKNFTSDIRSWKQGWLAILLFLSAPILKGVVQQSILVLFCLDCLQGSQVLNGVFRDWWLPSKLIRPQIDFYYCFSDLSIYFICLMWNSRCVVFLLCTLGKTIATLEMFRNTMRPETSS